MTTSSCSFCGAALQPRARFCPVCGRPVEPAAPPVEAGLPAKQVRVEGDALYLRELINVVESGVRWWQNGLASADAVTRERAASAIEELSQILHSLSKQVALGRETVRMTTRLPVLSKYRTGCPVCGRGNREGAHFCQRCGAPLPVAAAPTAEAKAAPAFRYTIASRTDVGRVRKNNQDSVYTGEFSLADGSRAFVCLVADGMGGAAAGEYASQVAAEETQRHLRQHAATERPADDAAWAGLLREAVRAANARVYADSRANEAQRGMGTTLTIALLVGERVHLASVGDSRAYLLNAAGATNEGAPVAQLTSDHSLVARLVDIGQITPEEARTHPQRNLLYRSIGTDPNVEADTRSERLKAGDMLLLCSDGLVGTVRDEELAQFALQQDDLDHACEQMVALANARGGTDNISVVLVRVEAP